MGIGQKIVAHLKARAKAFVPEIFATVSDKIIPQGASEIAQGLFTGNPYVPSVAEGHDMEVSAMTVEPAKEQAPEMSQEIDMSVYTSRGSNAKDRELTR